MFILRRFFGIMWPDCRGMVIRFGVESLSGLVWNPYPFSRGMVIRFGVEYTHFGKFFQFPNFTDLSYKIPKILIFHLFLLGKN